MTTPSPLQADVRLTVHFGGMAAPLREQQVGKLLSEPQLKLYQRFADAVLLLCVHKIITNADSDKALKRLGKRITSAALTHKDAVK